MVSWVSDLWSLGVVRWVVCGREEGELTLVFMCLAQPCKTTLVSDVKQSCKWTR